MKGTVIEVEIKVPLSSDDLERIQAEILELGGTYLNSETQQDTYYNHPCKSFQETDEAVRVRRHIPSTHQESKTDYPLCELAYKGPKLDDRSKTRLELSIGVTDVVTLNAMLEHLGFQNVATIVKNRTSYRYGITTICIDVVDNVGLFIELERLIPMYEEIEPVREQLFEIVMNLGIDANNAIRASYLELYLDNKNR